MADDKIDTNENASESNEVSSKDKSIIVDPKIDDSPAVAAETTRSKIARGYIWGFFGTIAATFIVGLFKCFEVKDYRDLLITVSGILSGPLGFIIGYYFKSANSKD